MPVQIHKCRYLCLDLLQDPFLKSGEMVGLREPPLLSAPPKLNSGNGIKGGRRLRGLRLSHGTPFKRNSSAAMPSHPRPWQGPIPNRVGFKA